MSKRMVEYADGTRVWYRNGKEHRDDGPAYEGANGTRAWYRDGKCHRDDGPAVENADGTRRWYRNDKLHREDGPALDYEPWPEWWLNGRQYNVREWRAEVERRRHRMVKSARNR